MLREVERWPQFTNGEHVSLVELSQFDHSFHSLRAGNGDVACVIHDSTPNRILVPADEINRQCAHHVDIVLQHLVPLYLPPAKSGRTHGTDCQTGMIPNVRQFNDVCVVLCETHHYSTKSVQLLILTKVTLHRQKLVHAVLRFHLLEGCGVGKDEINRLVRCVRLICVKLERDKFCLASIVRERLSEVSPKSRTPALQGEFRVAFGDHTDNKGLIGQCGTVLPNLANGECRSRGDESESP
mmetsp:Transcript_61573/g.163783  ORF Transcript_61573/g.163783 Transcript_61573/m.163783 type:complete len:240 (+) Transcript_61573:2125-2844(+)